MIIKTMRCYVTTKSVLKNERGEDLGLSLGIPIIKSFGRRDQLSKQCWEGAPGR
jgi:hypothetical protein